MDVERTVASRISASIGVDAYLEVPRERPDEFVTVELSSTSGGRFVREAVLAVQSWAATRRRAAEIASLVESAVYNLVDEPGDIRRGTSKHVQVARRGVSPRTLPDNRRANNLRIVKKGWSPWPRRRQGPTTLTT